MGKIHGIVLTILCIIGAIVYWPSKGSEFVLDDYYTIVHNPLIKQPSLYSSIWHSRLFDAHKSSGYIKLSYYRPVLESSYIVDYNLFGLNVLGYKWVNLLIHITNAFLVYLLLFSLFKRFNLSFGASLLFLVLPVHEWIVRCITARGDSLQTFFGLLFLLSIIQGLRSQVKKWYFYAFIALVLSALTREFGYLMPLYAALLIYFHFKPLSITRFSLIWIVIGCLQFVVTYQIIPKLGLNVSLHLFYFTSIGFCLLLAQARLRFIVLLSLMFAVMSYQQGRYWISEQTLLRHIDAQEKGSYTVARQQLLMKYDEKPGAISDLINHEKNPIVKSMWFRRLGDIYRKYGQTEKAVECYNWALALNPKNIDVINTLAVIDLESGRTMEGKKLLGRSLGLDLHYPETLRLWGIYYYREKDFENAKGFLNQSLFFDPDNVQAKALIKSLNP